MKLAKLLLLLALASPNLGLAQSYYTDRAVGTSQINNFIGLVPLSYAQVRVCGLPLTVQSPCQPVAQVYDINGNPLSIGGGNFGQVTTDVVGRFNFRVSAGDYHIQVAATGSNTPQLSYRITVAFNGSNFEGFRFTDAFASGTVTGRQNDACNSLAGAYGTVVVPSHEPIGMTSSLADNCFLWDLRGTSSFNQYGTYGASRLKGWTLYNRWTADNSVSPTNQTFSTIHLFTDIAQGGINVAGNKSNYSIFNIHALGTTEGQKFGLTSQMQAMGYGDAVGVFGKVEGLSGNTPAIGDEGAFGGYFAVYQDTQTFRASVQSVSGSRIYYNNITTADYYLGEGRPLVGNSVYSTGTACASSGGACPGSADGTTQIRGVGTTWTSIAAPATDYCFVLDAETRGTLELVIPITAITSDTTLTIEQGWPIYATNNAGTYSIRKCSRITKVDRVGGWVEVVKGSLFSPTDLIYNAAAHNHKAYAGRFTLRNTIASTDSRTGVEITNVACTGNAATSRFCRVGNAISISGNFGTILEMADSADAPNLGINFARSNALSPRTWLESNEGSGGDTLTTDYISHTRHSSLGGARVTMRYIKNDPASSPDTLSFGGPQTYVWTPGSSSATRFADFRNPSGFSIWLMDLSASPFVRYSNGAGTAVWEATTSGMRVNVGVLQGTGMKHGRVTTGSIGAGARADVTLSWGGTAFTNTSYTVGCSVTETSASGAGLRFERVRTKNAGSVVAQVMNDSGGNLTGDLECWAYHD